MLLAVAEFSFFQCVLVCVHTRVHALAHAHVHVSTYVCGGQRSMLNVSLYCSPPYLFRQGLWLKIGAH